MVEFAEYARALLEAQQHLDPGYEHRDHLEMAIGFLDSRTNWLKELASKYPDFA
jgi:hypothetical protein